HPRQDRALMRNQHVAAKARGCGVLLHARVFSVIALDRTDMIAGFHDRNELVETGSRWHEMSNLGGEKQIRCSVQGTRIRLATFLGAASQRTRTSRPSAPAKLADTLRDRP